MSDRIVAIRTAKWSATIDVRNSTSELDGEIKFAGYVALRVLSKLISHAEKRPVSLDRHYMKGYCDALTDIEYALKHPDKVVP